MIFQEFSWIFRMKSIWLFSDGYGMCWAISMRQGLKHNLWNLVQATTGGFVTYDLREARGCPDCFILMETECYTKAPRIEERKSGNYIWYFMRWYDACYDDVIWNHDEVWRFFKVLLADEACNKLEPGCSALGRHKALANALSSGSRRLPMTSVFFR